MNEKRYGHWHHYDENDRESSNRCVYAQMIAGNDQLNFELHIERRERAGLVEWMWEVNNTETGGNYLPYYGRAGSLAEAKKQVVNALARLLGMVADSAGLERVKLPHEEMA